MRCYVVLAFTVGFALLVGAGSVAAQEERSATITSLSGFPRLDLSLHGGPLYPSKSDPEATSSGVQLAFEPIFRLNAYWGVGLSAQYARLGYSSRATAEDAGDVYLTQAAVVGRFTPLADSNWHPYVQLGVGVGDYVQVPKCRFCSVADAVLLSAAAGGEYSITPRVRLGLSVTAFLFGLGIGEAGVAVPEGTPPAPVPPPWSQMGIAPRLSITTVWGGQQDAEAQTAGNGAEPEHPNAQDVYYPRLDLSLHGGPLYPLRTDPDVTSLGLQTALESVVRLNPYFGVGLGVQYAQLNFESTGTDDISRGANAGRIYLTQAALIARTTPLGDFQWVPYFQLGVGTGDYVSVPKSSAFDLLLLSAASGLEYELITGFRLGLSVTAFLFGLGAMTALSDPSPLPVSPSPTERLEQTAPRWPRWGVAPRLSVTKVWQ